jgi:hypothetical protein
MIYNKQNAIQFLKWTMDNGQWTMDNCKLGKYQINIILKT